MKRVHAVVSLTLALTLGVTLPMQAAEVETAKGLFRIDKTPEKIAVYDMAAADTLDALGIPIAGLPNKVYVPELEHLADGAERVGTLFEPDLEALSALGPDLVIVGSRSSTKLEAVSHVAPAIDMTIDSGKLLDDGKKRLLSYGEVFGKRDEAEALAQKLDAALDAARTATRDRGTALIVMTNGPKVSAFGSNSRFGWVHSTLGVPPAVEKMDVAVHGEAVSFEFIRDAKPDWLIVLDRAAATGTGEQNWKATLDNELVRDTPAWKKNQVVALPAADFYIAAGGVQSILHVLDTITTAFAQSPASGK